MIRALLARSINMCLAYPGKIIKIISDQADVDFGGIGKKINISLVDAQKGDYVVVHAGFAIQKLSRNGAMDVLKLYEETRRKQKDNRKNK